MILATLVVRTVVWESGTWVWCVDVFGGKKGKGGKGSGRREGGCGQYTHLNKQEKPRCREYWVGKGSEIGAFDLE